MTSFYLEFFYERINLAERMFCYKYLRWYILMHPQVSPDVMYNGLPWPDEEFTRVTVERDLKINITLTNHPILWKILWGLAEARPALCYCSVLLRASLAVQVLLATNGSRSYN